MAAAGLAIRSLLASRETDEDAAVAAIDDLAARVRAAARLASQLVAPDATVLDLVVSAYDRERDAGVQGRLITLLSTRGAPGSREAKRIFRAALDHPDPAVRLIAASQLGAEGAVTLTAIAADVQAPDDLRAAALRALGRSGSPSLALLHATLQAQAPALRLAAVDALVDARDQTALPLLLALAETLHPALWEGPDRPRREGAQQATAVAWALGILGDEAVEGALLPLLGWNEDEVQVAAAHALGEVGTTRSVDALLPLAEATFESEAVQQAARGAVQRLLSHLGEEAAGAVSLVGAPAEQGAVSLVSEPAASGAPQSSSAAASSSMPFVSGTNKNTR